VSRRGVKWARKSAEQAHEEAQFGLGWCYYRGIGVSKDQTEAIMWLRKSAQQGNEQAVVLLQMIEEEQARAKSTGARLFEKLSIPSHIPPR